MRYEILTFLLMQWIVFGFYDCNISYYNNIWVILHVIKVTMFYTWLLSNFGWIWVRNNVEYPQKNSYKIEISSKIYEIFTVGLFHWVLQFLCWKYFEIRNPFCPDFVFSGWLPWHIGYPKMTSSGQSLAWNLPFSYTMQVYKQLLFYKYSQKQWL